MTFDQSLWFKHSFWYIWLVRSHVIRNKNGILATHFMLSAKQYTSSGNSSVTSSQRVYQSLCFQHQKWGTADLFNLASIWLPRIPGTVCVKKSIPTLYARCWHYCIFFDLILLVVLSSMLIWNYLAYWKQLNMSPSTGQTLESNPLRKVRDYWGLDTLQYMETIVAPYLRRLQRWSNAQL